ncbi:hypothetical protein Adt_27364 [Abeliophyllum distichum]|uniref:Uncharacterized protein n=1 Tax=Abeliophyllum distichum TaxID=126358 RepID=A0ABD1RTI5_9LAMI
MSVEDWHKCIDFFASPTFVEQSSKNKANRDKAKYSSMQGSKSFSATRYDETCMLLQSRFSENDEVTSVGLDGVPKGTSTFLDLTAASKAPQGTFHQFSGDPQNNDPRFAMYKAKLRRMQRKIELLKNIIPVVVPEEDENEDKDEGLGDL